MNKHILKIREAKKKKFLFGEKPVYKPGKRNSVDDISSLESKYSFIFPTDLKIFLLELGAGSTEDLYVHGPDQIYPFDEDNGPVEGFVAIASDTLGNFIAFNPKSENPSLLYYVSHDPIGYGVLAENIDTFLTKFVSNGFDNLKISNSVQLNEFA